METAVNDLAGDLETRLRGLADRLGDGALGVSVHDFLSGRAWHFNGDRWFHAASVIKIPVMVALFDAIDRGRFALNARLLVRNRFLSAVDGTPFRVDTSRDGDSDVHEALWRTMRLRDLARRMMVRSSNLATNLLIDLLGTGAIRGMLQSFDIDGIDLQRGVEDDRAFELGINNRVTANGVVALLRAIVAAPSISPESSTRMMDILLAQEFSGTIAPGLPDAIRGAARVGHKTGEISTASHDAGIVQLPGRPPYLVAILVEGGASAKERSEVGCAASAAVYDWVAAAGERTRR